jgi:hypothetical protein
MFVPECLRFNFLWIKLAMNVLKLKRPQVKHGLGYPAYPTGFVGPNRHLGPEKTHHRKLHMSRLIRNITHAIYSCGMRFRSFYVLRK